MIEILLSSFFIDTRGLKMPPLAWTDPYLFPSRRDYQRPETRYFFFVGYPIPVTICIIKSSSTPDTPIAGGQIGQISKFCDHLLRQELQRLITICVGVRYHSADSVSD